MEQPLWLTLVEAFSAASVALFTGMLYFAQQKSNRVLERQAEIQTAQQRLMELLETRPWLVLGVRTLPHAYAFELYLSNAGRSAAVIEDILRHHSRPTRPQSGVKTPLEGLGFTLPLALPPGRSEVLVQKTLNERERVAGKGWLEVHYRTLSAEAPLLSDLWRLEEGRFVLEWAGEEVEEG